MHHSRQHCIRIYVVGFMGFLYPTSLLYADIFPSSGHFAALGLVNAFSGHEMESQNQSPSECTWKLLDSVVEPMANWSQLAFPRMLAPAAFSFITQVASYGGL